MKKSMYIILAVLIAAGLTAAQSWIAGSIVKKGEVEVCRAVNDIKVGNIIYEEDIETIQIYKGRYENQLYFATIDELKDRVASRDIPAGSILCAGDIDTQDENTFDTGFVALEVNGENFNAGNLEKGDFIDLYMLPDLSEIDDRHIMWLNNVFAQCGVSYIPGRQPGVLIENVLIEHIDTATGQAAKYVSIRVKRPLDEAITFLEQISVYEFIGR